jgi:hypothetical protein
MRPRTISLLAIVLLAASGLSAQSPVPLEKAFPYQFGGWRAWNGGLIKVKAGSEAEQNVLVEAGLFDVMAQSYKNGDREASLALYELRDPSGAYEVSTYYALNGSQGIQVGNFFVLPFGEFSDVDRQLLIDAIRKKADPTPLPPIRTYLPDIGRLDRTERYALGPQGFKEAANALAQAQVASMVSVAGFESHAEAMFGKYKNGKDAATLLLIEYPTPQLAELHLRHLQRALADAKLTTSSVERKGSLLSIVLTPTSPEYAAKLRASVNYETQVTWNEAAQTATDPPITSTLVKIIVATGVFMVVTLAFGIAFGGVRVITKRLFPGKVFDRKEQIEVLQLGLSSKPIDPSDMY